MYQRDLGEQESTDPTVRAQETQVEAFIDTTPLFTLEDLETLHTLVVWSDGPNHRISHPTYAQARECLHTWGYRPFVNFNFSDLLTVHVNCRVCFERRIEELSRGQRMLYRTP